jgi:hypothetical protein
MARSTGKWMPEACGKEAFGLTIVAERIKQ